MTQKTEEQQAQEWALIIGIVNGFQETITRAREEQIPAPLLMTALEVTTAAVMSALSEPEDSEDNVLKHAHNIRTMMKQHRAAAALAALRADMATSGNDA